jgi:hypothetical protein
VVPFCCIIEWNEGCADVAVDSCDVWICDCNGNGVADAEDIASGESLDVDGNGIPDECEDCNGNGVWDCEDLSGGGSVDCNDNGIPDECESQADCNENGVQDICDLAVETSLDCNANAVPDECDIAGGLDEDCNGNVVPDGCEVLCSVDIVFVLDVSGSMYNDLPGICDELMPRFLEVLAETAPGAVRTRTLGINSENAACAEGSVADEIGTTVPGDPESCPGPLHVESWGAAAAIVAEGFAWNEGALRVIVPISDEGPCQGEPCENPGPDRDTVANAGAVAVANEVVVFAVTGLEADSCVIQLANTLGRGTGGDGYHREEGPAWEEIADLLAAPIAARLASCNDRNGNLVPDDCELPGDLDGDGTVGINDFLMLLARWGLCPEPCPPTCVADVDFDCDVGVNDFLAMLANWG